MSARVHKPPFAPIRCWFERAAIAEPAEFWIVLALAFVFEALWFAIVPVGFFMDSLSYLNYALALVGKNLDWGAAGVNHTLLVSALTRRTSGYALLLLVTGAPKFHSFVGILALQAVAAVAMPVLVFKTLEPHSRRAAFVASLIIIVSLEPFTYSKVVSSDHVYKFLLVLLVYLASAAYRAPSRRLFSVLAAVGLLLTLVRPQGSVICFIIFAMLLIAHLGWWKSIVTNFAALGLGLSVSSFALLLYVAPDIPNELWPVTTEKGRISQTLGDRLATLLFYGVYFARNGDLANSGTDVARRDLRTVLDAYAQDHAAEWTGLAPRHYFGTFANDPRAWVDQIYRDPNPFYLTMIRVAAEVEAQSPDKAIQSAAGSLVARLDWDMYWHRPHYILSFLMRTALASGASSSGQQIWAQQYTSHLGGQFSENNGPASKEIFDLVHVYFNDFPDYPPPAWRGSAGMEEFFSTVANNSSERYWYFMWEVVDRLHGRIGSSPLFFRSAQEFPDFYYNKSLRFIGNMDEFLFGMPSNYIGGEKEYDDESVYFLLNGDVSQLPDGLREQVKTGMQLVKSPTINQALGLPIDGNQISSFGKAFTLYWLFIRTAVVVTVLATCLFGFWERAGWLTLLLGEIIVYQAAAVSFITDVYIRYIDQIMPLAILLAGLTVTSFVTSLRRDRLPAGERRESG